MGCVPSSVTLAASDSPLLQAVRFAATGQLLAFVDIVTRYQLSLDWHLPRSEGVSNNELANAQDGPTLLIIAANEGHKGIVEWMMKSPHLTSFIDATERFGGLRTALYCAAERGFQPIVEILLAHGANPNKGTTKYGFPLHIAARTGNVNICKLLLQHKADINAVTEDGRTALTTASFYGQRMTVEFLLGAGTAVNFNVVSAVTDMSGLAKTNVEAPMTACRTDEPKTDSVLTDTEQEAMQKAMMERGMAVSRGLSARIAKLALLQATKDADPIRRLIPRDALEQTLYDSISCHAVVFYLATEDECAASFYQMQLSDILVPLLVPFLDENETMIADEIKRGSFAFIKQQQDAAQKDAVLRRQLEATERQVIALNRQTLVMQSAAAHAPANTPTTPSSNPPKDPPKEADWSKRMGKAQAVFNATKFALSVLPF